MTSRETETHYVGLHSAHKAINRAVDLVPNELNNRTNTIFHIDTVAAFCEKRCGIILCGMKMPSFLHVYTVMLSIDVSKPIIRAIKIK